MSTIVINVSIKFQITFWAHFTNFEYLLMYSRIYSKTLNKLTETVNPVKFIISKEAMGRRYGTKYKRAIRYLIHVLYI